MANIGINSNEKDVQMHIEIARKIIDEYLPSTYVEKVLEKLPKGHRYSKKVIRNVRANLNNRLDVLNALVEVAKENQAQIEKLKILTT
ncbi:hypothetical protein [Flavobacterium nitratireducens]|uniref:hypothetical protein n=1 Tax=Flavobacterium nitratireducens TaxID=992289 RepID=UPI00241527C5|nr:hypothetical protein [Flavobacterium nitratireducens]